MLFECSIVYFVLDMVCVRLIICVLCPIKRVGLNCGIKANCPHAGHRPVRKLPSVGSCLSVPQNNSMLLCMRLNILTRILPYLYFSKQSEINIHQSDVKRILQLKKYITISVSCTGSHKRYRLYYRQWLKVVRNVFQLRCKFLVHFTKFGTLWVHMQLIGYIHVYSKS